MSHPESLSLRHQQTAEQLQAIARRTGGTLGYCVRDLTTREQFACNESALFSQASAIKIPLLMEVFKQSSEGRLNLAEIRRIENQDKTAGSGILGELGDGTVRMSLRDLCVLMIVLSDNTATNILIDLVGMQNVNQTMRSMGLEQTRLQRRMMDQAAASRGEENLSTPAEAARIMEVLFKGEFINEEISGEILRILKIPKTSAIGSALPPGTLIAGKPGNLPRVTTEWALVLLENRPYLVTVMENGGVNQECHAAIKEMSRCLHDYFQRPGADQS